MEKEYSSLHNALETSARTLEGIGCAFAAGGYHGLAMAARAEAVERKEYAMQILHHMEGHSLPIVLPPLPAPKSEYQSSTEAMDTACKIDMACVTSADSLVDTLLSAGRPIFFEEKLQQKIHKENEELCSIKDMVMQSFNDKEKMHALNISLAKRYSGDED